MTSSACCDSPPAGCSKKQSIDYWFWGSFVFVGMGVGLHLIFGERMKSVSGMIHDLSLVTYEMMEKMFVGMVMGIVFVGVLNHVPQRIIRYCFGSGKGLQGILRAAGAGILLDLCNHGILIIGMNFYKKGISLGQLMAFLIASPWNSFSLTVILIGLIGWKITLLFIILSFGIAVLSGLLFEAFVSRGVLPPNPYKEKEKEKEASLMKVSLLKELRMGLLRINGRFFVSVLIGGVRESRFILKWLFIGVILMAFVTVFVPDGVMNAYFGPTVMGLCLTMVAATVIEVCSEGSVPIAGYLVTHNHATGNAFAFLMGGVSTDYTEIMALREASKSWKIAFFLPLVTLPQILLLSLLLNLL